MGRSKSYFLFLLLSQFNHMFYNFYIPFLAVGIITSLQKCVGIFGALKCVGLLGASGEGF